jgi:hypothetical protein
MTTPAKAGEELFTFYGYKPSSSFPSDFLWYWETKRDVDRQERLEKEEQARLEKEKRIKQAELETSKDSKKTTKKKKKKKKGGENETKKV